VSSGRSGAFAPDRPCRFRPCRHFASAAGLLLDIETSIYYNRPGAAAVLARVHSATLVGIEAVPVDVEVDVSPGIPMCAIVGLPDPAVREARERVRTAIRNAGCDMPARRVTVNLAPADLRKVGPAFDLPIALGILTATRQLPPQALAGCVVVGELSLDGAVRPVAGVLSIALGARRRRARAVIVPEGNGHEAALVEGLAVHPVASLASLVAGLTGRAPLADTPRPVEPAAEEHGVDLADVRGQGHARRALEIAAAGGHNLLMIGPPGTGKTMLARRLPTILPALSAAEALEVTRVYSAAGRLPSGSPMVRTRPFRAPHHATSVQALVGGGTPPGPGEVSLAHLGVLFLDEAPEFRADALAALRQPLEEGRVVVTRVSGTVTLPARCMLVAAMNPCPCGNGGGGRRVCTCTPSQRARYRARVSGPLLDRIDLHVEMPALSGDELDAAPEAECSAIVRARVIRGRERQASRASTDGETLKAAIPWSAARAVGAPVREARALLRAAVDRLGLSPRAYHRIVRVARTIADLDGVASIDRRHVAEAIGYRCLDRPSEPELGALR
jgi:magnesium chelatase family protein